MFLSCLLPTYGRYVNKGCNKLIIVEEAIQSFLLQEDPDSELILLNDQKSLKLHFDHPQVRVYNLDERFESLGTKRNHLISLAKGDVCVIWDDDDISLPGRLHNVRTFFEAAPDVAYAGAGIVGFSNDNCGYNIEKAPGCGRYAAGAFRREIGALVGYQNTSSGEDTNFCNDLHHQGYKVTNYVPDKVDFIYRWGLGIWHISPIGCKGYITMGQRDFEDASIELEPKWSHDYEAEIRQLESKASVK